MTQAGRREQTIPAAIIEQQGYRTTNRRNALLM